MYLLNKTMGLVLLILSIGFQTVTAQQINDGDRPNIIFIMADDLGYGDLGAYGQELIQTPNIDALANAGMKFSQAYAGGPVCTSSRSVLMTGLHNGHTVARDNVPHYPSYLQEGDVTLAQVLKNAGYSTGGVGKWSLGDAQMEGRATNMGFDTWTGYLNQDHAHYYYPSYLDHDDRKILLSDNPILRNNYSHDILTNATLNFIRENSKKPFFFYSAYTVPHFSAPEEDEHGLTVPSTYPYTDKDWPEAAKKYAAMIYRLDKDVGKIVKLINELGIRENTLIIFTSDNGGHSNAWKGFKTNGKLKGYKRDLYEGGIRVPFIASWPGVIPAGQQSDEVIGFQDMMPTFAGLSNASIPENIDGVSVVEALKGNALPENNRVLYWDFGHTRQRYDQAVRIGDWKGIRRGQGQPIEIYDLAGDVSEQHNLANAHPELVNKIDKLMQMMVIPSPRYPVGQVYKGGPIWKKDW
ncbi:arylsulfatase [Cyclobacterium qasimii]|uniref:Arylsulfatase n=2 Tax=Cyclobacterium qasimii TaxID=1350429 RepID=S7WUZ4_9BACT|nr:arylsulfatase [Cyclobacterium qasimii]EPR70564.1 Arylsulfatase [Cyclobacterium qasimii M12-11B]GEO22260.1 N-acetylgalactosamine-6-sulfatase [Cyclobacterium qasimii]